MLALYVAVAIVAHVIASDAIGAEVFGRALRIPDPLNASLHAIAFDFNGVSINATYASGTPITTINVALTTSCYQRPDGVWSQRSAQPHRFRVYIRQHSAGEWSQPNGVQLISTNDTQCNVVSWATAYASTEALVPPFDIALLHITEADWNAANATIPNYVLFHEMNLISSSGNVYPVRAGLKRRVDVPTSRRIEFIGDSITAGYCNVCNLFPNQANTFALQDFSYSWAHLTCTALGAECNTEAWSGRGVIQNCDKEASVWMPTIVRRAIGTVSEYSDLWGVSNAWDFDRFVPDALVVNLGTNDYGCNAIPNITAFNDKFEAAYVDMLDDLLSHYHNRTQGVFIACGPMSTKYCPAVANIIATMHARGWPQVHFLNHTNLLPQAEQCCGHPDTIADAHIANVTVGVIRAALGW